MRSRILLLPILVLALHAIVVCQPETPTAEEQKAVDTIRERFNERVDKEGRLEPLIPEMFVANVGGRYAQEHKAEAGTGPILLTPGIEYKREVLDTATADDWQHALTATFDFMHLVSVPMLNQTVAAARGGSEPDADKIEAELNRVLSKPIVDLFAAEPVLKNYLRKNGTYTPIATAAELRRVADTLDKARDMIVANLPAKDRQLTPLSVESLKKMMSDKDFGPWVATSDREMYGFPKGQRFILFFASPMEALTITKVGGEFKIVSAQNSSPD
jgi:hypothetical protein